MHIFTSVLWLFFFAINTLAGYRSDNFSSRCYCCKVTVGRTIGALGHGFALTRLYWFREASWVYDRVTCQVKVKGCNYYQSFLDPFALELHALTTINKTAHLLLGSERSVGVVLAWVTAVDTSRPGGRPTALLMSMPGSAWPFSVTCPTHKEKHNKNTGVGA